MADSQLLIHKIQDAVIVNFSSAAILDSLAIDAIARDLYALIDETATSKIVLDFSGVKFMASQAIGVLITLKTKADEIDGKVVICAMPEQIRRVFSVMNLTKMFEFRDNEKAALAAVGIFTD